MAQLRQVLFWIHLVIGLSAGLLIAVMCATGVLLTYQRQMQYWADTRHYRQPSAHAPLPVDVLVARIEASHADGRSGPHPHVSSVSYRADPALPVAVSLVAADRSTTVYANPSTGAVYGPGTGQSIRRFFSAVTGWHRWLALAGPDRNLGRSLNGAANLVFLLLVLSGLYLWWPRVLRPQHFLRGLWLRPGLPPKARHFNRHHVVGFWTALPLLFITVSGLVISYPWASDAVYRVFGEAPPARQRGADVNQPVDESIPHDGPWVSLESLKVVAANRQPDWKVMTLRFDGAPSESVAITLDRGDGGQPHLRSTLTVDRATGREIGWSTFDDQTKGRRARSLLRFLHTGEAGGLAGQTIAGLVSLGGLVLVYSGAALSWRRFRKRPAPNAAPPSGPGGRIRL